MQASLLLLWMASLLFPIIYPSTIAFVSTNISLFLLATVFTKIQKEEKNLLYSFLKYLFYFFIFAVNVYWIYLFGVQTVAPVSGNTTNKIEEVNLQNLVATTTEVKKENTYIPPKKVAPVKKPVVKKVDPQKTLNQECSSKVPGSIYSQQYKQCVCPQGWYSYLDHRTNRIGCTFEAG